MEDVEIIGFFGVLAVFFVAAMSILWSTLRSGSAPMPSTPALRKAILAMLESAVSRTKMPRERPLRVLDLGSGWGGLARDAAHRFPSCDIVGVEIAFLPWMSSWLFQRLEGPDNLQFTRASVSAAQIGNADVILAYLSGPTLTEIAPLLRRYAAPGAAVICAGFALPSAADQDGLEINLEESVGSAGDMFRSPVYLYRMIGEGRRSDGHENVTEPVPETSSTSLNNGEINVFLRPSLGKT